MTLLLVSPKDVAEALVAVRGGADIIDVKNPIEGSLGANFPWVISQIRQGTPSNIPISAAIGDFPDLPGSAALAAFGAVEAGADIIKIGLKGVKNEGSATFLMKQVVMAVKNKHNRAKIVACLYGDSQRAGTINPTTIPRITHNAGADIAMLDTAIKDGTPLTAFMDEEKLRDLINQSRSFGLDISLAGCLGVNEIIELKELDPDVIGVRGVVCKDGAREGMITEKLVRRVKNILVV